jgi:nucleoside-diphosphate-sugar epimerase
MVKNGVIVQPGDTEKHLVFIDDLCRAFELAMETADVDGEVFLIAGEGPTKLKDLVDIAAHSLSVPSPRFRIPAWPVTAACALVERIFNSCGARPPVHRRSMDFFTRTVTCDTSKAKNLLGFQPKTDVQNGVRSTVEWLLAKGHI